MRPIQFVEMGQYRHRNQIASRADNVENKLQQGCIGGREMAKIRRRITAIGLGIAFAIGANLTVSAQAPVPVRKAPPPAPPANQAQPTPAQPANAGGTVTLHCGVAGISNNLFNTSGLRCPDPITPSKCSYVIWMGWGPTAGYDFNQVDFTCTARPAPGADPHFYGGTYTGISADAGGTVTFATTDHSQVCVATFPPAAITGIYSAKVRTAR